METTAFTPVSESRGQTPRRTVGVLAAARRRWPALVVCIVLVPVAALAFSLQEPKEYTATASLLFQHQAYAQGLFGTSTSFSPPEADPARAAATNLSLVQQTTIAQLTAHALGRGFTPGTVEADVSAVSGGSQSDLVQVTATTRRAALSEKMANAYANQFISYRKSAQAAPVLQAARDIAQQLASFSPAQQSRPAARELATREQDLRIYALLQTGDVQLSQPATKPSGPSSPRPVRNLIIGLFVGLLLGVCAALLLERLDRRVRDVDEFEQMSPWPLLGSIPESRALAVRRGDPGLNVFEIEAFRTLRTRLRYLNTSQPNRVIVVNSCISGEGKSSVCWNLATAAAASGQRVLLVEADMRRPVLAARLGMPRATSGLSDYLAGHRSLHEIVRHSSGSAQRPESNGAVGEHLVDLIVAGTVPPNPLELLELPRLHDLLSSARTTYDFVVIDTPPAGLVSDAVPLFRQADGVLVIVRPRLSRRDETRKYFEQLSSLGVPVLGIVENAVKRRKASDDYYGYTEPDTSSSTVAGLDSEDTGVAGESVATPAVSER